jgi:hypothetical protein
MAISGASISNVPLKGKGYRPRSYTYLDCTPPPLVMLASLFAQHPLDNPVLDMSFCALLDGLFKFTPEMNFSGK